MVLIKIILVGVALVALMAVARDREWGQKAGIVGSCTASPAPRSTEGADGSAWYTCEQGIMTGFPNLEGDSCQRFGTVRHKELWSCTTPLESLPAY